MTQPLPVIFNTFRCAIRWRTSGAQTAVNVLHVRTAANGKTAAQVFACLDAHVTAAMWGGASSNFITQGVDITPLDGTTATQTFTPAIAGHWTGGTGGDFIPSACGIVKFQTASRGVRFRGRLYLPPVAETAQTNGSYSDTSPATATAAWGTFLTDCAADATTPLSPVVASYDRAHGGAGATATTITRATQETVLATQRRRQKRLRRT